MGILASEWLIEFTADYLRPELCFVNQPHRFSSLVANISRAFDDGLKFISQCPLSRYFHLDDTCHKSYQGRAAHLRDALNCLTRRRRRIWKWALMTWLFICMYKRTGLELIDPGWDIVSYEQMVTLFPITLKSVIMQQTTEWKPVRSSQ